MAIQEDVNVNLSVIAGSMGGIAAITSGMSALTSTFGEFGSQAVQTFGEIDGLLVSAAGLIGLFGVKSAEAFGEFEQGMKIVQAVSGQSSAAIQQLSAEANRMSVGYRTAIGDITEGLQTLGRAGLNSSTTQLEVLESGLQTAKLEGKNLNGVLEELIQNTSLLGGDLTSTNFGEQAKYLNTLFVGTSMAAPIDTHDVSQTLQYAGGTAAAAGANLDDKEKLEDLMGTVAAFAQKGVVGSMAGTALRAFFTKPASQDTSVTNALDTLGLTPEALWEDGGNSMKKVSDQIAIIKGRMESLNLSTIEQVELWGKIVGPKMGQQMMKLDASSIRGLTTDIQNASSAQSLAAETLDTYNQKVSQLGEQGQVAFREFGEKAALFLTPVVEGLIHVTEFFSNPVVNFGVFAGAMGLLNHGIGAARNMLGTTYTQIKSLIADARTGLANLATGGNEFGSTMTRSASNVDILNTKLKQTNTTLQEIQARALGINGGYAGMAYIANGMEAGELINRGVVASAAMNVFRGDGTIGEEGKIYTNEESKELKKEANELNKRNKEIVSALEDRNSKVSAEYDKLQAKMLENEKEIKQIQERRQSESKNIADRNAIIKDIEHYQKGDYKIDDMSKYSGNTDWDKYNRYLNKDGLEARQNALIPVDAHAPKDQNGKILQLNDVIDKRKSIEADIAKIEESIRAEYKKKLDKAESTGMTLGKDPKEIENMPAYKRKVLLDRDSEINKATSALNKQLDTVKDYESVLREIENTKLDPTLPAGSRVGTMSDVDAFRQANAESKKFIDESYSKEAHLRKQNEKILNEVNMLKLVPDETFEKFPVQTKEELAEAFKNGGETLGAQLRVVTQGEYDRIASRVPQSGIEDFQRRVNEQFHADAPEAFFEKRGEKMVAYYDFLPSKKSEQTKESFLKKTFRQAKESGIVDEYGDQAALLKQSRQKVFEKQDSIRDRLRDTGSAKMQAWNKALDGGVKSINDFKANITQSWQIWRAGGIEPIQNELAAKTSLIMTEMQTEFKTGTLTVEEAMIELAARTGLSVEQLGNLIIATEGLEKKFIEMGLLTEDDTIATGNEVKAKVENVIATKRESMAKNGGIISRIGGKLTGALSSVVGMLGGPFMAAMMGATVAMQAVQEMQRQWQEKMNNANSHLSEALDEKNKAEESIKDLYRKENKDVSESDLDLILDTQYGTMASNIGGSYDSMTAREVTKLGQMKWTDKEKENNTIKGEEDLASLEESAETITLTQEENISELKENTVALNAATYAYVQAQNEQQKAFSDGIFGFNGLSTQMSDNESPFTGLNPLKIPGLVHRAIFGPSESILDSGNPVLTESQASKDYSGSTELAGIMSSNIYKKNHDFFSWLRGDSEEDRLENALKRTFGKDSDRIINGMKGMEGKLSGNGYAAMQSYGSEFAHMTESEIQMAQLSLKNDKESYQKLAKQSFRYEQQYGFKPGRTAYADYANLKKLANPNASKKEVDAARKALGKNKLTVQDKNLLNEVAKLSRLTDGKLSEQNILAMGQLQQLQDMYQVASEQVAPGINQTVQGVFDTVTTTSQTRDNAGTTAANAGSAANNAAAIAAFLGDEAQRTAEEKRFKQYVREGGTNYKNVDEFVAAVASGKLDGAKRDILTTLEGTSWSLTNADSDPDHIKKNSARLYEKLNKSDSYAKQMETATWGIYQFAEKAVGAAYDQSRTGEYGGGQTGSGGGGGGGSGKDSGKGKDKNSGSKKERVDLVLCNKKEIPKLNVNLFKKPPNFTILNKNFKLRDIKINSQDKPKAILNAIKNGIIETSKRMDPKIIQSEDGVFDPLNATEGTAVPKGSAKTTT